MLRIGSLILNIPDCLVDDIIKKNIQLILHLINGNLILKQFRNSSSVNFCNFSNRCKPVESQHCIASYARGYIMRKKIGWKMLISIIFSFSSNHSSSRVIQSALASPEGVEARDNFDD